MSTLLMVANPRWQNPVTIRTASVSASWGVSVPWRLSALVPSRLLAHLGVRSLKGSWVLWEHHTLGLWAGIVQDENADLFNQTIELGCTGMTELLRKRRTARTYVTQSAPPGALALRAIADADSDQDLLIDDSYADEDGEMMTVEWRGDDLFDLITSLAGSSDHEFDVWVGEDRRITFAFRGQIGTDKTGTVLVIEGREILDGTIQGSTYDLINDRLAVSDDDVWAKVDQAVVLNGDSIDTYGRAQDTATYDYATRRASLKTRAEDDLRRVSLPALTGTFRIAANQPVLAQFSHGDTIRVWSSTANAMYELRVKTRAVDDTDVVTIAGDLTEIT